MNITNNIAPEIYSYLIEIGFVHDQARFILAQFAHETKNFQSKIFLDNHNVCGMKFAGQKLAKGQKNGHAYYEDIFDSIEDYKVYYKLNKYLAVYPTIGAFVAQLKAKGYFEAKEIEYFNSVNHFYNLYFGKA